MPLHQLEQRELRDHCRRAIESLELWLRRLIHDKLSATYGAKYFSAHRANGGNVIGNKVSRPILILFEAEPSRYPRPIDAALLEHAIDIVCNPDLFHLYFREALAAAFPVGREQARTTLLKLIGPRNSLAHAGALSVRQEEQVICYARDVIDSIKEHYGKMNMSNDYNAPSIVRFSDSAGNVFHLSQPPNAGNVHILHRSDGGPLAVFRVGETLSIEIDIDSTFPAETWRVQWTAQQAGVVGDVGSRLVLPISNSMVNERFEIQCQVISDKPWHRRGAWDDILIAIYKVLPSVA